MQMRYEDYIQPFLPSNMEKDSRWILQCGSVMTESRLIVVTFIFIIHWEKALVVVTHFFFVRKGHNYIFFIMYYLYTLVLTTRLIK